MKQHYSFPEGFSQHDQLPIRLVTPDFGHLPGEAAARYGRTHRLPYYFFLLLLDGFSQYRIDGAVVDIGKQELLLAAPHQVQELPAGPHGRDYFKLGFSEECLALLPRQYPFLLHSPSRPKIALSPAVAGRLQAIFQLLRSLLDTRDANPELILARLNSLLTEINAACYATEPKPAEDRLSGFSRFRIFVEEHLTEHPSIAAIARSLAMSTDSLYQIVRQHSGLSPKEYVTHRLILEARRRLCYGRRPSTKELAYDLGFNDPGYFSRLFKKMTGKTVAAFVRDLS